MTENIENIVKIDTNSFADMCKQIIELEEENKSLKMDNDFLQRKLEQKERMLKGVKLNNSSLTLERNNAIDELNRIKALGMYEFASKYCTSDELEEAGHALARSLLGKPMTDDELAIEAAENGYKPYVGDDF